jgi:isocitrate dehydrogenase kinase/phosphatase
MIQAAFPKLLSSQIAFDIARTILRRLRQALPPVPPDQPAGQAALRARRLGRGPAGARARIDFYDQRVQECVQMLEDEYEPPELTDEVWRELKLHYIGMLSDHKQPELAETFFNSVCCNILHRSYFHNDFIFVRPVVSTEYIETEEPAPTYRVYYPGTDGLRFTLKRIVTNFQLACPLRRPRHATSSWSKRAWQIFGASRIEPNHQIQVLSSLFFRNKGAYIVGKGINGNSASTPLSCPSCTTAMAS